MAVTGRSDADGAQWQLSHQRRTAPDPKPSLIFIAIGILWE